MWADEETVYRGQHLYLNTLKQWRSQGFTNNGYLLNYTPAYPRPELQVTHVSHSTDLQGLQGIRDTGGFEAPSNDQQTPKQLKVVWFSLTVSPDELRAAESRRMRVVCPGGREEIALLAGGTLQDFATSPAFRSRSRYGSFRFTFSLEDVLDKYSQQFCRGRRPVLRVYRTVLYKQEVMYAVLVHSPINNWRFCRRFPLLEDMAHSICAFRMWPEPHFVWRPESMSDDYRVGLMLNNGHASTQRLNQSHFFVWDHVALALHVGDKVLSFEDEELRENLTFCERDVISVPRDHLFLSFRAAQKHVRRLWPNYRYYSSTCNNYYYDCYYYYLQCFHQSRFHISP